MPEFYLPSMCSARKMLLWVIESNVNFLTRTMIIGSLAVNLFIMQPMEFQSHDKQLVGVVYSDTLVQRFL